MLILKYNHMSEYLSILIAAGAIPFIVSFWPALRFYKNGRALFISIAAIVMIFGAWDIFATYRRHWYFNPEWVYPVRVMNLPLEEVLFFIIIPFCCIFTWEVILFIVQKKRG